MNNILARYNTIFNGAKKGGAYPTKDLQVIIYNQTYEDGGTTYLRTSDGSMFEITNADEIINGVIPFKSNITIKAPSGISDVTNGFWYDGVTPNELYPQSFFNDIDYEHKIFVKTQDQVLDGNGVEISPAGIKEILVYSQAKDGNDLIKLNNYCGVPLESATAKWCDYTNGNDTTGVGTKVNPYKTIYKAFTEATLNDYVYVKSGSYLEDSVTRGYLRLDRQVNIKGLGLCNVNATTASTQGIIYSFNTDNAKVEGLNLIPTSELYSVYEARGWTFERCVLRSGTTAVLHNTSTVENINSHYKNCNIVSTNKLDDLGYNFDYESCYISLSTANRQSPVARNGSSVKYCYIDLNNTGETFYIDNNFTYIFKGNKINVNANISSFVKNNLSVTGYSLEFNYNDLNINNQFTKIYDLVGGVSSEIKYNNYNSISSANNEDVFRHKNILSVDFQNNIVKSNGTLESVILAIQYNAVVTTVKNYIKNNRFEVKSSLSPTVVIGAETTGTYDDLANDIQILNNYGINTGIVENTSPLFFIGHNVNPIVKYNYADGFDDLCVYKHTGGINTTGVISYNVSKNSSVVTMTGVEAAKIYNNIGYFDALKNTTMIVATPNSGQGLTNTEIKNNILVAKNTANDYRLINTATGFSVVSNYNNFYAEDGIELFSILGVLKTKAEWLAAGFDANSLFTNPLLNSDLIPQSSSPTIGNGSNLGINYDDGLNSSTNFGDSETLPSIVTKQQSTNWDIGAYVS